MCKVKNEVKKMLAVSPVTPINVSNTRNQNTTKNNVVFGMNVETSLWKLLGDAFGDPHNIPQAVDKAVNGLRSHTSDCGAISVEPNFATKAYKAMKNVVYRHPSNPGKPVVLCELESGSAIGGAIAREFPKLTVARVQELVRAARTNESAAARETKLLAAK